MGSSASERLRCFLRLGDPLLCVPLCLGLPQLTNFPWDRGQVMTQGEEDQGMEIMFTSEAAPSANEEESDPTGDGGDPTGE